MQYISFVSILLSYNIWSDKDAKTPLVLWTPIIIFSLPEQGNIFNYWLNSRLLTYMHVAVFNLGFHFWKFWGWSHERLKKYSYYSKIQFSLTVLGGEPDILALE